MTSHITTAWTNGFHSTQTHCFKWLSSATNSTKWEGVVTMTTRTQSHDKPPESHDLITFFFHKHLQPQHPGVCVGRTECHQVQRLELVSLDVDDREAALFGEVASRELEAVGATSCPHLLDLLYGNCSGVKRACGRIQVRYVQLHNIHPPNLYTVIYYTGSSSKYIGRSPVSISVSLYKYHHIWHCYLCIPCYKRQTAYPYATCRYPYIVPAKEYTNRAVLIPCGYTLTTYWINMTFWPLENRYFVVMTAINGKLISPHFLNFPFFLLVKSKHAEPMVWSAYPIGLRDGTEQGAGV